MDNTDSPSGRSQDRPVVLFVPKTRLIGRTPPQTAIINKTPLMGFLSRRGEQKTPSETKGNQGHPPPQTSFRQSNVPDHTTSPQTRGVDRSKQTENSPPPHQTSFPQSESPDHAPSSVNHQATNPHTTPNFQTQSFTDNQHSHGQLKTNTAVSQPQDHTLFSTRPLSITSSAVLPDVSSHFQPHRTSTASKDSVSTIIQESKAVPTESVTRPNQHKGGKSLEPHSETITSSTSSTTKNQPTEIPFSIPLSASSFSPPAHGGHSPPALGPGHRSKASELPSQSGLPPLTSNPIHSSDIHTHKHQTLATPPLESHAAPSTTRNQPTHSDIPTEPLPQHTHKHQTTTSLESQAAPSTQTIRNQPTHSDIPAAPFSQHTHKHQTTTSLESQAVPFTHTTAQVATRPLIPIPKHISKVLSVPSPIVTAATTAIRRPGTIQPDPTASIIEPLPFTGVPRPQTKPIGPTPILSTNKPEPFSPSTDAPVPTNVPTLAGIVVSGTEVPSVKPKELQHNTAAVSPPFLAEESMNGGGSNVSQSNAFSGDSTFPTHSAISSSNPGGPHKPTHSGFDRQVFCHRSSASNNSASIIGGVLGAIIGLLVIGFVVVGFCFYRRKVRNLQKKLYVYEKDGDVAPPLYDPKAFGVRGGYDSRAVYGQRPAMGNQDLNPSDPFIAPYTNTQQTHDVGRGVEDQDLRPSVVPGHTKSNNPFTNLAYAYPYQANGGGAQEPGFGEDEKLVQSSNDVSQYPVEEPSKGHQSWDTLQGTSPGKTFDAHLSKISTGTTLSVGSGYTTKRSSIGTHINDNEENFATVQFDSLKMVKPRNAPEAVGIAM